MGLVKWLHGKITNQIESTSRKYRKIKIRKGLPSYLPERVQKLVKYGLLHDFFHTSSHRSKIYLEPKISDSRFIELLREHHTNTENELVKEFQQYDRRSALISRKIRSPINSRYNWKARSEINFQKLADEIAEAEQKGVWKLYEYIQSSKELEQLAETLEHGHSSLRNHLLLIANIIVENYLKE